MVYNIEKMLKEHRDKVSDDDAKAVEDALEETKKAMQEGGIDEINKATSKLETASHKLAEAMYKAPASRPRRRAGAGAAGDGAVGRASEAEGQRGRRRVRGRRRQEVSTVREPRVRRP